MIQIKEVTNTINNEEFINKNYLRRLFAEHLSGLLNNLMSDIRYCYTSSVKHLSIVITFCIIDANEFSIISGDEYLGIISAFRAILEEEKEECRLIALTALVDYVTKKFC